jgi:hypothetical protein
VSFGKASKISPSMVLRGDIRVTIARPSEPAYLYNLTVEIWGHIVASSARLKSFTCPKCNALYQVVKVEAGPETEDRAIACSVCGGPLAGREAKFVLKYFLLREAVHRRRHGNTKVV